MQSIIKEFIRKALKEKKFSISLEKLKKDFFYGVNKSFPKNTEIKQAYEKMIKTGEIKRNNQWEQMLVTRRIRSLSGVAVVAVLTKPFKCPGQCAFCPTEKAMPKSYLSNEPAANRAKKLNFSPYRQVQARLKVLALNSHPIDKVELIVMGGTFSYLPKKYQTYFIKECFRAANDFSNLRKQKKYKSSLAKEKKRNETAKVRIIGITLETRPDFITEKELITFRKLGATRVELGIQSIDDKILKKNKRGHTVANAIQAIKLLKDFGFKVNLHLMPGLPGSSSQKDLKMFKEIFSDEKFQPDMIKIYPCVVTQGTVIYNWWKQGKFKPLTNRKNKNLMIKIKAITPPYVRISRLIRDIPNTSIIAGPSVTNLRQKLKEEGIACRCIRCREVGINKDSFEDNKKVILNRIDYQASEGKEVFLEFVSPDKKKLYAILRLRIISKQVADKQPIRALKNATLIRELHTYGKMVKIGERKSGRQQHIGWGKKLLREAEKITKKETKFKKIVVIAGVGVRDYYRQQGYRLQDEYLVKKLK